MHHFTPFLDRKCQCVHLLTWTTPCGHYISSWLTRRDLLPPRQHKNGCESRCLNALRGKLTRRSYSTSVEDLKSMGGVFIWYNWEKQDFLSECCFFHLSSVQILWDNLRGAKLSEKDGGELETTEASQKRCDHSCPDGSKWGTHRWQQDPTSAGAGRGIPGGTGMWRCTRAQTWVKTLLRLVGTLRILTLLCPVCLRSRKWVFSQVTFPCSPLWWTSWKRPESSLNRTSENVTRTVSINILHSLQHFPKTDEITKNKDFVASLVHVTMTRLERMRGRNWHYLKPSVFNADLRATLHKNCCGCC